jgi:hypothetical protein
LHSRPFTNSHFNFFITVKAASSEVLLQKPKKMQVRLAKVRTIRL